MWKYEIGLNNCPHRGKTNCRGRKGREKNWRWRIRVLLAHRSPSATPPPPRSWWMSAHFFHLALITARPLQSSGERAPVSSTVVKTSLESLERCPTRFQKDPAARCSRSFSRSWCERRRRHLRFDSQPMSEGPTGAGCSVWQQAIALIYDISVFLKNWC